MYTDPFIHSLKESFTIPGRVEEPAAPVRQELLPADHVPAREQVQPSRSKAGRIWGVLAAISAFIGLLVISSSTAWGIGLIVLLPLCCGVMWICGRVYDKASPAERAAMIAAGGLAMYDVHRRHEKGVHAAQERSAQYKAGQAARQQQATQEEIRDLLRQQNSQGPVSVSGTTRMTPHSDIYGNLT
jgi:hypothetical protein